MLRLANRPWVENYDQPLVGAADDEDDDDEDDKDDDDEDDEDDEDD